jgi:hypothetical protein
MVVLIPHRSPSYLLRVGPSTAVLSSQLEDVQLYIPF